MLTIWGRLNSHNVKKVAWFAEELGLSYVRHDIGGQFGMSNAYLAMNPNALIPTIDDDGFVLWESNAILRYLAARHGGVRWWPDEPQLRAIGDRWMEWQVGYALAQLDAFVNLVRVAPDKRDMAAVARRHVVERTVRLDVPRFRAQRVRNRAEGADLVGDERENFFGRDR